MKYQSFSNQQLKWLEELQRVMLKAPRGTFIFAGSGSLVIYPKRYMTKPGGVDRDAPSEVITTAAEVDGGDW